MDRIIPDDQEWEPGIIEYWFLNARADIVWKFNVGDEEDEYNWKTGNHFQSEKECIYYWLLYPGPIKRNKD